MFMCSPCLYLHDYSIFAVTREPEQNCRLWKVRWREQQGHNSNETSWGGLSSGFFHSTWWVLPFSSAGRVFSQEMFSGEGHPKLLLLLDRGVPVGCSPALEQCPWDVQALFPGCVLLAVGLGRSRQDGASSPRCSSWF